MSCCLLACLPVCLPACRCCCCRRRRCCYVRLCDYGVARVTRKTILSPLPYAIWKTLSCHMIAGIFQPLNDIESGAPGAVNAITSFSKFVLIYRTKFFFFLAFGFGVVFACIRLVANVLYDVVRGIDTQRTAIPFVTIPK